MPSALDDVRQALRTFAFKPRLVLMPVMTLALGMAAASTVYSLLDWALIRPLPGMSSQDGLATIEFAQGEDSYASISFPVFEELLQRSQAFEKLTVYDPQQLTLALGEPMAVKAEQVTEDYFEALAALPTLGRGFTFEESRDPGQALAVVSHRLQRSLFGDDALGRTVLLNGTPATVVGVAPAGFGGPFSPHSTDVWMPASQFRITAPYMPADSLRNPGSVMLFTLIGRLSPGWTVEAAAQEIDSILASLPHPQLEGLRADILPGVRHTRWERQRLSSAFALLSGAVALVMLVAAVNAAGLLLNRSLARRQEMAVRQALGAGRADLLRLQMVESLLISGLAAVLGLALSYWGFQWVSNLGLLGQASGAEAPDWNWRSLGFAAGLAVAAAIASGLAPAWAASRPGQAARLRGGQQSAFRGWGARSAVVIAQVGLSFSLLVGAGLFLRTLHKLYAIDAGMQIEGVQAFTVAPQMHGYQNRKVRMLCQRLIEALPGIQQAESFALSETVPFAGSVRIRSVRAQEGPQGELIRVERNSVAGSYFETLGIALLQGRPFNEREGTQWRPGSPRVAIVSQSLAQRLWPDSSAEGRFIQAQGRGDPLQVVGVVADHRPRSLRRTSDLLYEPLGQGGIFPGQLAVLVRPRGDASAVAPQVRALLRGFDPSLAPESSAALASYLDGQLSERIMLARLVPAFALTALFLAALGLHASVAWAVRQRLRELGIRMALGAAPWNIGRLVISRVMAVTLLGLGLGLALAASLSETVSSRLYGVSPLDPASFALAALALILSALLAAAPPLHRATRIDPARTLRCD